jgi:hypothetical protein
VIVDLEGEAEQLLARLMNASDGRVASEARAELLRMGAAAAHTVAKKFPGPVHQSIDLDLTDVPAASECGPVLDIAVALGKASVLGRAMVQELVRITEAGGRDRRVWALLALADIGSDRAIDPVLQALMDDDAVVRRGARWAAVSLACLPHVGVTMREAIEQLSDSAAIPTPARLSALQTLGAMRDGKAVPVLIRILADPDGLIQGAALKALRAITLMDLPPSAKKWNMWWAENETRPRMEWLIDALTSPVDELRDAAGRELAERTGRDFGYRADMPSEARHSVQARYRAMHDQDAPDSIRG